MDGLSFTVSVQFSRKQFTTERKKNRAHGAPLIHFRMQKFGHEQHNDCWSVALYDAQRRNEPYVFSFPMLLQFLNHPGRKSQHQLPTENTACATRSRSLVNAQCFRACRVIRNARPYVPLHIVVAEICKDKCLNNFREKHH